MKVQTGLTAFAEELYNKEIPIDYTPIPKLVPHTQVDIGWYYEITIRYETVPKTGVHDGETYITQLHYELADRAFKECLYVFEQYPLHPLKISGPIDKGWGTKMIYIHFYDEVPDIGRIAGLYMNRVEAYTGFSFDYQITVMKSKNDIYSGATTGGGSGSGSGSGSGGQRHPTPTLDKLLDPASHLAPEEKEEIEHGIEVLKRRYPKASALFDKLENCKKQIKIIIDPDMDHGTIKYNPSLHTLTFLGIEYVSTFGALEDWAHVAQCEVYYPTNIPNSRDLEFEAKMFCDLNCAINSNGNEICNALGAGFNYDNNWSIRYCDFKDNVSHAGKFNSELLSEYYQLGQAWNDPNYQTGKFQRQPPRLLMDLFK